MWQKSSWRPAGAGKWLYAGVLLLLALYGSICYAPSIAYWRFRLGQDHIALGPDIALQLKRGWYPVLATQDTDGAHVVVLKINPWFPSEKSTSVLNFIYNANRCPPDFVGNPSFRAHRFPWGVAAIYKDYKIAFALDGKVTVHFGDIGDLGEIARLSTVRQQVQSPECQFRGG